MPKSFHTVTRDLHLYLGLFVSPFVIVFAVSVFVLVHPSHGARPDIPVRTVSDLKLEPGIEALAGRARIEAVHRVLDQAGVRGEIGFIRHEVQEHRFVVPVDVPGRTATVDIDLPARVARISERKTGLAGSVVLLHKSPGPHLADIRMNWFPMRVWRWLADTTVYIVLFISVSGIYLWAMIRSERRAGLFLLLAGVLSFAGIIYALVG